MEARGGFRGFRRLGRRARPFARFVSRLIRSLGRIRHGLTAGRRLQRRANL